jgi:hypothetical protein
MHRAWRSSCRPSLPTNGEEGRIKRQLLSLRFYLNRVIADTVNQWMSANGPATNYATLLEWIQELRGSEPALLVTFNYDSMVDQARRITFGDGYGEPNLYVVGDVPLIRPHGYIGWSHLVGHASASANQLISDAGTYEFREFIGSWGSQNQYAEVPAIAIPTRGKAEFECPQSHIDYLTELLPRVTEILTIGWRAQEEAFLSVCKGKLPEQVRGLVVSRNPAEAKEVTRQLSLDLRTAELEASPAEGFSDFIGRGIGQLRAVR